MKNLPSCLELHIAAWYTTRDAAISFFENLKESFLSAVSRHGSATTPFNSIYQLMICHILVPKNTENVLTLRSKIHSLWEYFFKPFQGNRVTVWTEPFIIIEVGTLKPSGNRCENRQNWFLINYKLGTNHIFHCFKLKDFLWFTFI